MSYFTITEISLLLFPVLGFFFFILFRKSEIYRILILILVGVLFIYYALKIFHFSFTGDTLDLYVICLSYLVYACLLYFLLLIKHKKIRYLVFLISLIPIIIGYNLSTIGILGLAWIVMDYEIKEQKALTNQIHYRKYNFGIAISSEAGVEYDFYKTYKFLPFEKKITEIIIDSRKFDIQNLRVDLIDNDKYYRIKIDSKDMMLIDTTIEK